MTTGQAAEEPVYSCFGLRLRSQLRLDELQFAAPGDEGPVVEIRLAPVPERIGGGGEAHCGLQVAGEEALLRVPRLGRFLIRNGRQILIEPCPDAAVRNLRLFLLGSVLAILCRQRGLLPLHANGIVVNGGAHAFAGRSGSGKSTLAAFLERAGYEILCDDICMIAFDDAGLPVAMPGVPRLKLWADAAEAVGHDSATLEHAIEGVPKYHVPMLRPTQGRAWPLRRLYLMDCAEAGQSGSIVRLKGQEAMQALMTHGYRTAFVHPLGQARQHFRQCASLLQAIRVYSVSPPRGLDRFAREAERLEKHLLEEDG